MLHPSERMKAFLANQEGEVDEKSELIRAAFAIDVNSTTWAAVCWWLEREGGKAIQVVASEGVDHRVADVSRGRLALANDLLKLPETARRRR